MFELKMVLVSRGSFWMSKDGENAKRQVEIPHDFSIGVYPVTQGQWQAVMGNNPSWFSRTGEGKDSVKGISDADLRDFPVECVSWNDVQEFLKKLNAQEKNSGWLYRLPTEAEWEYSCRGGLCSKEDCSFGYYFDQPTNNLSSEQANFNYSVGHTSKVGLYKPNRLGIYDLHGNVWEWCDDSYDGGTRRVFRGGSWNNDAEFCRAAFRFRFEPDDRDYDLGFRLARVAQ